MIRTESLEVRYGTLVAVRSVSLNVALGRITALVGPSGCGKSSFLAALNRMTDLIPGAETTGRVFIGDRDIRSRDWAPADLRRRIGMIFQRPNPFATSIRSNIHLALREHGIRARTERDAIMRRVLTDVGLWAEVKDRLKESALKLSGGQQQRLCIARALALEPDVLLMDEPCSALDPMAAGKVESLIKNLRGRFTIVIVTHNLAQARRVADEVAIFWVRNGAGQLIEQGPVEEIFTNPTDPDAAAYLAGTQG